MLNKIKKYKIYIIFSSFLLILWKAVKYGENKILFKQSKQRVKNEKKGNETDDIIDNATNDELSKLL